MLLPPTPDNPSIATSPAVVFAPMGNAYIFMHVLVVCLSSDLKESIRIFVKKAMLEKTTALITIDKSDELKQNAKQTSSLSFVLIF